MFDITIRYSRCTAPYSYIASLQHKSLYGEVKGSSPEMLAGKQASLLVVSLSAWPTRHAGKGGLIPGGPDKQRREKSGAHMCNKAGGMTSSFKHARGRLSGHKHTPETPGQTRMMPLAHRLRPTIHNRTTQQQGLLYRAISNQEPHMREGERGNKLDRLRETDVERDLYSLLFTTVVSLCLLSFKNALI